MPTKEEIIREYRSSFGRIGGAAGTGKSKKRGSKAYYKTLSKRAVAARKKIREEKAGK